VHADDDCALIVDAKLRFRRMIDSTNSGLDSIDDWRMALNGTIFFLDGEKRQATIIDNDNIALLCSQDLLRMIP
jgi:hypothetical protein